MNQNRPLVRDTYNRVFGGVCSGIANYLGWNITVVRVVAALSLFFFVGTPFFIYIILWIVIPADVRVYGPNGAPDDPYRVGYQDGWNQGYEAGRSGR